MNKKLNKNEIKRLNNLGRKYQSSKILTEKEYYRMKDLMGRNLNYGFKKAWEKDRLKTNEDPKEIFEMLTMIIAWIMLIIIATILNIIYIPYKVFKEYLIGKNWIMKYSWYLKQIKNERKL